MIFGLTDLSGAKFFLKKEECLHWMKQDVDFHSQCIMGVQTMETCLKWLPVWTMYVIDRDRIIKFILNVFFNI